MNDNVHLLPTPSTSPLGLSTDGGAVPIHWVEDLFARLSAIYGGAMANVYASSDPDLVKREWATALGGFSAAEVKGGLAACRTRKFAPNLGEFLHLCRPALDPEVAFVEAERGLQAHRMGEVFQWSHPAVYCAAASMSFDITSRPFRELRKRWEAELSEQFDRKSWPPIPDPTAKRIAADTPEQRALDGVPDRSDEVTARLRALRRKLTGYASKAEQDAARDAQIQAERAHQAAESQR